MDDVMRELIDRHGEVKRLVYDLETRTITIESTKGFVIETRDWLPSDPYDYEHGTRLTATTERCDASQWKMEPQSPTGLIFKADFHIMVYPSDVNYTVPDAETEEASDRHPD